MNEQSGACVLDIQDAGEKLIAELEQALDEGNLNMAQHAEKRAQRLGSANLFKSVIVPLAGLVSEERLTEPSDKTP